MVYKLQEYAGIARRKHAEGKATWPGRKQVWRRYDEEGRMRSDYMTLENDDAQGEALIRPVMKNGQRLQHAESLDTIRTRTAEGLSRLPTPLARLQAADYPVTVSDGLRTLADEIDRETMPSG